MMLRHYTVNSCTFTPHERLELLLVWRCWRVDCQNLKHPFPLLDNGDASIFAWELQFRLE